MNLSFRPALIGDVYNLWQIEQQIFNPILHPLINRRQFKYLIEKGNAQIIVAQDHDVLIGSAVIFFRKNSDYARLYSLGVIPEYQGKNVGKLLYEYTVKMISEKKLKGIIQEIRADNHKLCDRYQKLGYKRIGYCDNYYPDNQACIKLKKDFYEK